MSQSQGRGLAPTDGRTNSLSPAKALQLGDKDGEVLVRFCLKYRTQFGQSVRIIGSHPKLGELVACCRTPSLAGPPVCKSIGRGHGGPGGGAP